MAHYVLENESLTMEDQDKLSESFDHDVGREPSSSGIHLLGMAGDPERTANNELPPTFVFATGNLFRVTTKMTGVWNVRHKGYRVLCALFALFNILSIVTETLILTICGPLGDNCVSMNVPNGTNLADGNAEFRKFLITAEIMYIWNGLAATSSFILIIYSLLKLQDMFPLLSVNAAESAPNRNEWLFINSVLVISVVGLVSGYPVLLHARDNKLGIYFSFGFAIFINYYTGILCCTVFAVVSCAMSKLVTECFKDILNVGGENVNAIISLHQHLRQKLFDASGFFKVWFLVHWIMFGANCLSFLAFYAIKYSIMLNSPTFEFEVVVLVLTTAIFVVPSLCASRVTWKCHELLRKVSNRKLEDWSARHPFWDRASLNDFVFYAERSECGFRVGNYTFDSKGKWISLLVGVSGLVLKLLDFSKNMP